ncbi:MAG: signal recognition particle-docking protein FtsY [Acidobacteria bacterium]|nr:signal recognition particle-docking protein FtsY [Acidobacteriota bacterium]MBI3657012.1 signal recognition particle-docking protein FtsY [Acidobacteriota bacterium]
MALFGNKKPAPPEGSVSPLKFFDRLKRAVQKTKANLVARIEDVVRGKKAISPEILDELEGCLLQADVGVEATTEVLQKVRAQVSRQLLNDTDELKNQIKQELLAILRACPPTGATPFDAGCPKPWVTMVVGVNGTGKTTTIGKLAHYVSTKGKRALICASDTYRAAAVEQLAIWADRSKTEMVKAQRGSDPAALLFDAVSAAQARHLDVIIVDTAGRLHTKVNLMQELEKMRRVAARAAPGAPHEVLLILDATTGQNGLIQAREFLKASGVTGLVVTKLDGTAKGGVVIAIARELKLPIRFIGVGEGIEDLLEFNAEDYINSLFDDSV